MTHASDGGAGQDVDTLPILVVDDERSMREFLAIMLSREGHDVVAAENGAQALASLRQRAFDLLISDIRMPDCSGLDVLREAKALQPDLPGILMTAFSSTQTAIEALRTGALDYISKPFDVDEMKRVVAQAIERRHLREHGPEADDTPADGRPRAADTMIGRGVAMQRVFALIEAIAGTSSTVLVTGESGTGKEMAARAIHRLSPRADRPVRGAQLRRAARDAARVRAVRPREGRVHRRGAHDPRPLRTGGGGTIFLDEIGEMSPLMQVKLLRVLQERRFRRVGGHEELAADVRIIAATNRDLAKMVAEGTFREDLYYRVNVIPVALPPLRERQDDIPLLAQHFVQRFARDMRRPGGELSPEALDVLVGYRWPGNIRELENVIERAVALETGRAITPASLPEHMLAALPAAVVAVASAPDAGLGAPTAGVPRFPETGFDLERHVQELEREYLAEALRRADGVKMRAADLLGMSFRSFRYYAKKYNL